MSVPLEMVTQARLNELPSAAPHCPHCRSANVRVNDCAHTLLGGGDGTRDRDPNHWWESSRCDDCAATFIRETKYRDVWYTDGHQRSGRVLEGIATCFESYSYTCTRCAGVVERDHTKLDGVSLVDSLGTRWNDDGTVTRDYRTFYRCRGCNWEIEVTDE